ncbi:MAG: dihydropteroate synthase [Acidimicrobiales bacterium]
MARVMGIVNVTPDSFYPQSRAWSVDDAIARGRDLFTAGCDFVDVGGESTRPGATPVDEADELERVVPVVAALSREGQVSVDTHKAEVARAAVAAGARVINDVSASLADLAGSLGVGYVAMHRQGDPATMQLAPAYDDVVSDVGDFLDDVAARARSAGVTDLWLDPGIGFGKTVAHNLSLLARLDDLVARARAYGAGVLVGTSRKRFLANLGAHELDVDERLEGSIATEAWAMLCGVDVVRVHDAPAAIHLRELVGS